MADASTSRPDDRRFPSPPALGTPIPLSPEYLALIRKAEEMRMNQDGADKSWVARVIEASQRHFASARRV
jgi:hypothetical protein